MSVFHLNPNTTVTSDVQFDGQLHASRKPLVSEHCRNMIELMRQMHADMDRTANLIHNHSDDMTDDTLRDLLSSLRSRAAEASALCDRIMRECPDLPFNVEMTVADLCGEIDALGEYAEDALSDLDQGFRFEDVWNSIVNFVQQIGDALNNLPPLPMPIPRPGPAY